VTAWGDVDSDGDLDLILGGQMNLHDNVWGNVMKLYLNTGGLFSESSTALPGLIGGTAQWGDYDNDGDVDLLVAGSYLLRVYRNDKGNLVDSKAQLDGLESAAGAWGDYDNDGDLDFVIGGHAYGRFITKLYRNDKGVFADSGITLPGVTRGSFAWGDYDNDGDLDLFMMGYAGNAILITKLYRNDSGSLTDSQAALPTVMDGSGAWGDYDNDGDLDLLVTGDRQYEKIARVYRNDQGRFVDAMVGLPGIVYGEGNWVDYDNDGDLDIYLAGGGINEIYRNDHGLFSAINAGLPPFGRHGSVWGDYDGDGRLDLIVMNRLANGPYVNLLYHNNGRVANTRPQPPHGLAVSLQGTSVTFSWESADDSQTQHNGLTYNLRVGTASGSMSVVAPMALTSGTRQIVHMGSTARRWILRGLTPGQTYFWSVQAIDTGYAGSEFAPEEQFTLPISATPPAVVSAEGDYSITINDGALFTNQLAVTLRLTAHSGTTHMQLSNDGGFIGAQWEPFMPIKAWQLSRYRNYVIPRIVYVRFRDATGIVWGPFQDDIVLDEMVF
jgi:hypothetical protein